MSAILAIAGADAAERMRRFTFLIVVALALYAGYVYIPDAHAGYTTASINEHRGLYNSGYVGAATSLLTILFLSLVGFFFVRGSVERDWELHVDGAVASSPVSKITFLLGKWLSNVGVLLAVAALTVLASILMQLWHGEDRSFNLAAYAGPFALITLPAMAVVAALAVAFDVIKPLRGIIGGALYVLVVWMGMMMMPTFSSSELIKLSSFDPLGLTAITSQLRVAESTAYPSKKADVSIGGDVTPPEGFKTYRFEGMKWDAVIVAQRAGWLAASIAFVVLVSPLFDRFRRDGVRRAKGGGRFNAGVLIPNIPGLRTLRAEVALLLNGANIWWVLGAAALIVAELVAPLSALTGFILPAAIIWPLERLSQLGARERIHNVGDILGATPGYTSRAMLVQWLAGALVGALLLSGAAIHLLVTGHALGALALLSVPALTSACALALGLLTGVARSFQALFLIAWYLGPVQHLPVIDAAKGPLLFPAPMLAVTAIVAAIALVGALAQRRVALALR